MPRNLDMTALRSFVAVAEAGGVTRAAGFLNLTQSAVSMQIKRLEDGLGLQLLDRTGRGVSPTEAGNQLLSYARRMLSLNDEAFGRLTHQAYEGEIVLGVPYDIVYPAIPQVLKRFSAEYPRMRVQLVASVTRRLKPQFDQGICDLILTTEDHCDPGGETLVELPLLWVGAPGGQAWKSRPLRLALGVNCVFRDGVVKTLDDAGIPWEVAVESESDRTLEATVSSDLAVHMLLQGTEPAHLECVQHGGALPELTSQKINLYSANLRFGAATDALSALLRQAYRAA